MMNSSSSLMAISVTSGVATTGSPVKLMVWENFSSQNPSLQASDKGLDDRHHVHGIPSVADHADVRCAWLT